VAWLRRSAEKGGAVAEAIGVPGYADAVSLPQLPEDLTSAFGRLQRPPVLSLDATGEETAMKTVCSALVALGLCTFLPAGAAGAESEAGPAPAPGSSTQPPPGILVTPPRTPPPETQQSCPDTGSKLELIV